MTRQPVFGLLAAILLAANSTAHAVETKAVNRAIERGVTALRRMQAPNGAWPHNQMGATALAGLTLLECGVEADDKAVRRAADLVRQSSITLTDTYSIALSILFLDLLGDKDDVPLIESLMVRLLAGQNSGGGWSYQCPSISEAESRRLKAVVAARPKSGERSKRGEGKRTVEDLPKEIREQLLRIEKGVSLGGGAADPPLVGMGDNSNTQFAAIGLWTGRRHGLPIEGALTRLDRRFRRTQLPDGGWTYMPMLPPAGVANGGVFPGMGGASASMTCAGLLALAIIDGATLQYAKERKPDKKPPDVGKDANLMTGLQALGAVIGNPRGLPDPGAGPVRVQLGQVGGRTYYFLWSLERVAVAMGLDTIGKKDWYGWGAEILLANQGRDGLWRGEYADSGADTCFALLFLRRANLTRDLTHELKGKTLDPGQRELRGALLDFKHPPKKMTSGIETKNAQPIRKPLEGDPESARLSRSLVQAKGVRHDELLKEMRSGKGARYTEALALAIPQLEGEPRGQARDVLTERLTRMKDDTLTAYLQDEDVEIRRAAALAVAMKDSKTLIPELIPLLRDPDLTAVHAAHAALKAMTKQDFGPTSKATREERDRAALQWLQWWNKKKK